MRVTEVENGANLHTLQERSDDFIPSEIGKCEVKVKKHKRVIVPWLTLAVLFFLVALVCGIGGTFASVVSQNQNNEEGYLQGVLVDKNSKAIEAYPGIVTKVTAVAENQGNQVMYARMKFNKVWLEQNTVGEWIKSTDDNLNTEYIELDINKDQGWSQGEDGWYYYSNPVAPGERTTSAINQITMSWEIGEEYNLNKSNKLTSDYTGKAAQVEVDLQCSAEPIKNSNSGNGDYFSSASSRSSKLANTGDELPPVALACFAIGLISIILCGISIILAKRRSRDEEE